MFVPVPVSAPVSPSSEWVSLPPKCLAPAAKSAHLASAMAEKFPEALERTITELSRLPTIGRRSAQRLAFHLLKVPPDQVSAMAGALSDLRSRVRFCRQCFYVTEEELCHICRDERRDLSRIVVVEEPADVAALEKADTFRGRYHVLLGHLSPLHGIGPESLKISELMKRLKSGGVEEVILATNPTVDGDATALYLSRLIQPLNIRVTKLGLGLPIGGSLEYADELTLEKAFESRRNL